jgi:ABC-type glycerol-3-phosphate transport system permease component
MNRIFFRFLIYFLLIIGATIFLTPFIWLLSTSFKASADVLAFPPRWVPQPWIWTNYSDALISLSDDPNLTLSWENIPKLPFLRFAYNTMFIIFFNLIGSLFTAALCAYGFARLRAPGKGIIFAILLSTMMLPPQVTMIPVFMLFQKLGWVNTFKPLIIPAYFGGGAFNIFLLRQFFLTLPRDLEEAAIVDGSSRFRIFWQIILPLSKPALLTVMIFSFLWMWNDFMGPLIYLHDIEKYTLAIGLNLFRGMYITKTPWGPLMAASTLMTFPIILLFFFSQRYFIRGIALTGIKA